MSFVSSLPWPRAAFAMLLLCLAGLTGAAEDYSAAERALFMSPHLAGLRPPLTLNYSYTRSGSLEPGFNDPVRLILGARPDGRCCTARTEFLTGARRLDLPEIEGAEANPVLLHVLERDIAEMRRLTKGSTAYFRKRIRMAAYDAAQIRSVRFSYKGKPVDGREIVLVPYRDDPMHERFEKYTGKVYTFTMSDDVPGAVAAVRTRIPGADAQAEALIQEQLLLDGVVITDDPRKP